MSACVFVWQIRLAGEVVRHSTPTGGTAGVEAVPPVSDASRATSPAQSVESGMPQQLRSLRRFDIGAIGGLSGHQARSFKGLVLATNRRRERHPKRVLHKPFLRYDRFLGGNLHRTQTPFHWGKW